MRFLALHLNHKSLLPILIISFVGLLSVLSCRATVFGVDESDIQTDKALETVVVAPIPTVEIVGPPSIPVTNFSLEDASKFPPEGILDEVGYYGIGGPRSFITCKKSAVMEFCTAPNEIKWLETFVTKIQGVNVGDEIQVVVYVPNGQQLKMFEEVSVNEIDSGGAILEYNFSITPDMPTGRYKIIFSGKNGTIEHELDVVMPSEPTVHEYNNKIILLGFHPNENVRLFVYRERVGLNRVDFVSWQHLTLGADGTLSINLPQVEEAKNLIYFIATGNGQILHDGIGDPFFWGSIFRSNTTSQPVQICPGLISRLPDALNAQVAKLDGSSTRVREKPGFSQEIVAKLPEGIKVMLVGLHPVCRDESTWWEIQTEDGIHGWMAESQNGVYLLEPYP